MSSGRPLIIAVTRMYRRCGSPGDEFRSEWGGIVWDSHEHEKFFRRLCTANWEFWLVHGCEGIRPREWTPADMAQKLASGEWPKGAGASGCEFLVLLFHNGQPAPPASGPRCCIVRTYASGAECADSARLQVLLALYGISRIPRQTVDEIQERFNLNKDQKVKLDEKRNSLPPDSSFDKVVLALRKPLSGVQSALQSWETDGDIDSRSRLNRICTLSAMEAGTLRCASWLTSTPAVRRTRTRWGLSRGLHAATWKVLRQKRAGAECESCCRRSTPIRRLNLGLLGGSTGTATRSLEAFPNRTSWILRGSIRTPSLAGSRHFSTNSRNFQVL